MQILLDPTKVSMGEKNTPLESQENACPGLPVLNREESLHLVGDTVGLASRGGRTRRGSCGFAVDVVLRRRRGLDLV